MPNFIEIARTAADICYVQYYASLAWKCLFTGVFWAHFPQVMSLIVVTPKRTVLGQNHVIWAINRSHGSSWAYEREKKDRTGKSHKRVINYLWRSPHWSDVHENLYLVGDVLDVITCAKFQKEIFRGYDFTEGRIFHFPIDFWMGLTTVQRYCAACDWRT